MPNDAGLQVFLSLSEVVTLVILLAFVL
ncbi:MAG TPA: hypothetical protein DHV04_00760 [Flavobacteriaceae bacterium]|nr:hypothetical protein [Flavobacteriaceae bacterium]